MAANTTGPIFELVVKSWCVTLTSADTTVQKSLGAVGSEGARIDSIRICTDDIATVNLKFFLNDGAIDYYIGNVAVAAGSGYTTVVIVDAINTLAKLDLGYLPIPAGWVLKVGCVATMTAAKTTTVVALGGNY